MFSLWQGEHVVPVNRIGLCMIAKMFGCLEAVILALKLICCIPVLMLVDVTHTVSVNKTNIHI